MTAGIDYLRGWQPPRKWAPKHKSRPDLCAGLDHPGNCFNPIQDRTWCLCGERTYDGDQAVHPKLTECGQPLCECLPACPNYKEDT